MTAAVPRPGQALVDAVLTGGSGAGAERDDWVRSRHAALVEALVRRGLDPSLAWRTATAVVAHWAREVGYGRSEYGYNLANVRGYRCARVHVLADGLDYCAYGSLREGVDATVDLLQAERYRPAWDHLLATGDGPGWYERLLRPPQGGDGWHAWSQAGMDEYASVLARVTRTVGEAPPPAEAARWRSWGPWALATAAAVALGAALWAGQDEGRRGS